MVNGLVVTIVTLRYRLALHTTYTRPTAPTVDYRPLLTVSRIVGWTPHCYDEQAPIITAMANEERWAVANCIDMTRRAVFDQFNNDDIALPKFALYFTFIAYVAILQSISTACPVSPTLQWNNGTHDQWTT